MLSQGHPLRRLMIRRAEGWPQPWMSRSGASPGVHPCNAWIFQSARASSSHSPCREDCLHVHHGKEDPGSLTQTGKNNHSFQDKKKKKKRRGGGEKRKEKGLFLQKVLKLTPLLPFKRTRTFRQHSPSFLPEKDLQRKSSEG